MSILVDYSGVLYFKHILNGSWSFDNEHYNQHNGYKVQTDSKVYTADYWNYSKQLIDSANKLPIFQFLIVEFEAEYRVIDLKHNKDSCHTTCNYLVYSLFWKRLFIGKKIHKTNRTVSIEFDKLGIFAYPWTSIYQILRDKEESENPQWEQES